MNMDNNENLPSYFNAAEKWPGKIHEPLDQGNCAGSWAFSTAGKIHCIIHKHMILLLPNSHYFCHFSHCFFIYSYSRSIRPNLHSVHGTHDPSALTTESDLVWQKEPRRLWWRACWWSLVVPEEKRVSFFHCTIVYQAI